MTSTSLINDGNTATNIIESTLAGSSGSNVILQNNGNMTIAEYVASTLTNLFVVTSGTGVKVGATSRPVEIIGNLLADGNLSLKSITTTGALNGTTITTTGAITGTKINLTTGSLTRVSVGNTGLIASGGTLVVTHNLGATPDVVLLTPSAIVTTGSEYYSAYTYTSTQFTITQTNANASNQVFNWLAIKL